MDLKEACSVTNELEQRARKHHAMHLLWHHSERKRARKQKRIADIQIRSLQARLLEDTRAVRESLSDSALKNHVGVQKIAALVKGLGKSSIDCARAHSLLSRMSA